MSLRWEEQQNLGGRSWWAYSHELVIGMVGVRDDGTVWYSATNAVSMKYVAKGHGEVRSIASAKRAVQRAWSTWMDQAGLEPKR